MTAQPHAVAVIGLGELGGPIALHLAGSGHAVAVSDLDEARVARLIESGGGRISDGRNGSAWAARIVLCLLPDSDVTAAVLDAGARAGMRRATVIDLSSGDPGLASVLERTVERAGAGYVAATVLRGSGAEAGRGQLGLAVGGYPQDVERVRRVLETLGSIVAELPSAAQAQTLKLVNNLVSLGVSALVAEAVAVSTSAGITASDCLAWLQQGSATNWVKLEHVSRVAESATRPAGAASFRAALAAKDLRCLVATASRAAVPTPVAGAVHDVYTQAAFSGAGESEAGTWPWRHLAGTRAEAAP